MLGSWLGGRARLCLVQAKSRNGAGDRQGARRQRLPRGRQARPERANASEKKEKPAVVRRRPRVQSSPGAKAHCGGKRDPDGQGISSPLRTLSRAPQGLEPKVERHRFARQRKPYPTLITFPGGLLLEQQRKRLVEVGKQRLGFFGERA